MKIKSMLLAITVLAAGCSKDNASPPTASTNENSDISIPQALIGAPSMNADEILISVNGKSLTRGEAIRQVQLRLGGPPPSDMPQERIDIIQSQVLSKVIDEFVKRELLLREADALEITATEEEIEKAVGTIKERTSGGHQAQGILQNGPAGKDSLKNEVITAIRIEKLLAAQLPGIQEPTDEEIEQFQSENREKLTLPERVRASHILIEVKPGDSAETKAEKRDLIESYRKQLLDGKDFAELAVAVSQCPSASRGGDLGIFPRGKMVKPFDDAAFSQNPDEIGPVVETPFGYHIIRVDEHLAEGVANREQIVEILKRKNRTEALAEYTKQLQSKADIKHSQFVRPPKITE